MDFLVLKKSLVRLSIVIFIIYNCCKLVSATSKEVVVSSHPSSKHCIWPTKKYFVHIANRLPQKNPPIPLTVHCASADDDLGFHKLLVNKEIQWHFCDNRFNTIFQCSFWWENHAAGFNVFDQTKVLKEFCNNNIPGQGKNTCYWEAKEDGFYLATPSGIRMIHKW